MGSKYISAIYIGSRGEKHPDSSAFHNATDKKCIRNLSEFERSNSKETKKPIMNFTVHEGPDKMPCYINKIAPNIQIF